VVVVVVVVVAAAAAAAAAAVVMVVIYLKFRVGVTSETCIREVPVRISVLLPTIVANTSQLTLVPSGYPIETDLP
jgi:hypothetical protein